MLEVMYRPEDVGKEVMNSRGKKSKVRKYHLTEEEQIEARNRWVVESKRVPQSIREMAGSNFYNPYRKGVYYYQIYAMFSLGANKWHRLDKIINKMKIIMSRSNKKKGDYIYTRWELFRGKNKRELSLRNKDFIGRIQENMIFFQRLNKLHPTGYKLRQVCSAVDIKRVDKEGFTNGCYFYRLSTYDRPDLALPIRDYSSFHFPKHERRYVSYKFIGTTITRDKIIKQGEIHDMLSV